MIRLYVRARHGPAFVLALVGVAFAAWWVGDWLAHRPFSPGPSARQPVAVLAPALVVAVLSMTLRTADEELERSTACPWRWIRLLHGAIATVACMTSLAVTGLWAPSEFGAWALVRNTAAAAGLVVATAVVFGAATAWLFAVCHAVAVRVLAARPEPADWWWAWPTQPSELAESWRMAITCCVLGLALYAVRGARMSVDRDG